VEEALISAVQSALSRRTARALAPAAMVLGLGMGCVKVYQPVSGLNQPVVVDPKLANFQDVSLTVYCPPGDLVTANEARVLCRKVGTLFENQGAVVTTYSGDRRQDDDLFGDAPAGEGEGDQPPPEPTTDLFLELRARRVHEAHNQVSWLLCFATVTLVPAVSEFTFAQDVIVRDNTGFMLVTETLQGRIVRYTGAGTWVTHKLLDRFWRDDEDEILGDQPHADLSADYYGQLSQAVFNAKMRWQVQYQASPASSEE
jgi:hypothetical protein